ncbi:hypothetical protein BDV97DRAFT_175505 [Delphinella strobiligena]|nr:hypothetical protein BDV97DRAFT_175505 [Delphinella strobiligena]
MHNPYETSTEPERCVTTYSFKRRSHNATQQSVPNGDEIIIYHIPIVGHLLVNLGPHPLLRTRSQPAYPRHLHLQRHLRSTTKTPPCHRSHRRAHPPIFRDTNHRIEDVERPPALAAQCKESIRQYLNDDICTTTHGTFLRRCCRCV